MGQEVEHVRSYDLGRILVGDGEERFQVEDNDTQGVGTHSTGDGRDLDASGATSRAERRTTPVNLRHQPTRPSEDRTVGWSQRRACYLTTEDQGLLAEHDDLDRQLVPFGTAQPAQLKHPHEGHGQPDTRRTMPWPIFPPGGPRQKPIRRSWMGFSAPTGIGHAPFRILVPFSHNGTIGPGTRGCLREYWIQKRGGRMRFTNRVDAGRRLAARLEYLRGEDLVVLGLPRGGVPVALEVAGALQAPLDVIVVRKLGVPFQPELGMGAIGEGGVRVLNAEVVRLAGVSSEELAAVEQRERAELERQARRFRGDRLPVPITGKTVVVVDDGIATGSTARAACQVARAHGAVRVILAVPVAPPDWIDRLASDADEFACVDTPEPFFGVGQFYADFSQTTDDEVIACLERGRPPMMAVTAPGQADDPPVRDEDVNVQAGPVRLGGHLTVPEAAVGVVLFAHGSGSSRHSSRNRYVAAVLNQAGLATLLFDLLSPEEELDRANVFDVELLARRLGEVTAWLRAQPETRELAVGYSGAGTEVAHRK